ncbi:MAG: PfkB family carbohydrate kinase [Candidatus Margulisbacteria bacterium]|nr:PfkB family carbohydrate kinase [Candidatus Margulisiibacteriota bacterium]
MDGEVKKTLVIGEVLYDIFEDNGYENLGGAPFNFAFHLNKFLGNVNFISAIGQDVRGQKLIKHLKQLNFPIKHIQHLKDFQTGIVKVILAGEGIPSYNIVEDVAYDQISLTPDVSQLINENKDLLYFGTLAQRSEVSRQTIRQIIQKTNVKIKFCDLNLRDNCFNDEIIEFSLQACTFLKINEDELAQINKEERFGNSREKILKNISEEYNIESICVTLGEKGSLLYSNGQTFIKVIAKEAVVDTVGAGDAFSAMLITAILLGKEPKDALYLASDFSSRICQIEGAIPDNDEWYEASREELRVISGE